MPTAVAKFDLDVLDFVAELERFSSVDAAMNALTKAFHRFGFETLVLTGLPNPAQRLEQLVLAKRMPPEWFKVYTAEDYIRVDPVARMCRQTVNPYEWSEAPYDADEEPRAAEVMRRAKDFRMAQGFVVPVHGLTGYEACISLSGERVELDERGKAAVHLMALYGFDRIRRMLAPAARPPGLTPREREVLAWSSQGKTAWEIGEILSITQRTVEEHAANACRKLGAANRTHAVVIAIRERILEP